MTTTQHIIGSRSYLVGTTPAGTLAECVELAALQPADEVFVLVDGMVNRELTDMLVINL